jgi:hypothetical protein
MAKAVVAIGGGEIRTRGTASIDREIIRLTRKKNPSILFVTSARVKSTTGKLSDYKRRMALAIRIIVMGANGVEI